MIYIHLHKLAVCALAVALLLTLCACEQGESSVPASITATSSAASEVATSTLSDGTTTQTFTFQVNSKMPQYKCAVTISGGGNGQIRKIAITDSNSGATIQTIIPPDNKVFTADPIYFEDVTFDNDLDIVIPLDISINCKFDAYVWDGDTKQFVEAPSFQYILQPAVDPDAKQMLSASKDSAVSHYYTMYSFEENQFVQTNQFSYDLASHDSKPPANADNLLHFIETKGDADHQTIVNDFYLPLDLNSVSGWVDMNNAQISPYFTSGSFWDIHGKKWGTCFWDTKKVLPT